MSISELTTTEALKVLLVEDNRGDARLVHEMLAHVPASHMQLLHVERLGEARRELSTSDISCVLLDLTLPDAANLEALMQLQSESPDLPIVILSGLNDEMLAVHAVEEGAQDYLIKGQVDGDTITRSIHYAIGRKRGQIELARQAMHDALTGLPNRNLFLDRLEHAIERVKRNDEMIALLFIDLDDFKNVNDTAGHDVGDRLLAGLADRFRDVLRTSDTAGRFGGDEFVVLCEDVSSQQDAIKIAERILGAIELPFKTYTGELRVGASAGIAITRGDAPSPETLIRRADAAMYQAKTAGTSFEVFNERIQTRVRERNRMETELRGAVASEGFRVLYQAQLDLSDDEVFGVEAFVRWEHPQRGLIEPADFLWLAEETGLITPIGAWVLSEASGQVQAWHLTGGRVPPRVSVNLSQHELNNPLLVDTVRSVLAETCLHPESLCLEVKESVVMKNPELSLTTLMALKDLGVSLALDDFGNGACSIGFLKQLPFDMAKIDRGFTAGLGKSSKDTGIVAAMVGLAHGLGLATAAEGIETADQLAEARTLECDIAQGYYLGHPQPADALASIMDVRSSASGGGTP